MYTCKCMYRDGEVSISGGYAERERGLILFIIIIRPSK